jgi:hypothetical protein
VRRSERLAQYRQIRLSTFGRLRAAGFALLATFDRPHFTLVLPDLSEVTVARLERCRDARSRTLRATHRGRSARISPRMSTDLVEGVDEDIVHNS